MRLINADNYKDKVIATVGYSGLYWLADINNVPTAYNVEKVIKKINSKIQKLDAKQKVFMKDGLFGLADNAAKKMEIYIECREIIENGGMTIDKNKKQTNADRIRAMSDEDLAFFLFSCTPHVEGEYMECIKSIEKMLKEDACPNFRSNSDVKAQETAYNVDKVLEQCENVAERCADCDEFVCSKCGIHLMEWVKVSIDEDYDDEIHSEYVFKYCPNCGAKIKAGD